ncbi:dual specificity protein phosphatase 3-like [Saccostrea echinata]|uniref:dual specificity protein phosphatase 3-like n=1 Tax=Saccostrea echinata TaxID=191078 RepID=UPI002A82C2CC|nr:dual specificity protein phosphatase 3-like [Saccostrea echinata]
MEYNDHTLNRVRHYLKNADIQALDRNDDLPEGYSRFFTVPITPKDSYNEVYPGIIIANGDYARNKEELKRIGITHVVNCAKGLKYGQFDTSPSYFKDAGIRFLGIQANDVITFDMSKHFEKAANFIDEALAKGGKVFVHCNKGISRSASIVLAFLMIKRGMNFMTAVRTVRSKREVLPNDGFLKQLAILNYTLYEAHNAY